jgi:hypothetical protein
MQQWGDSHGQESIQLLTLQHSAKLHHVSTHTHTPNFTQQQQSKLYFSQKVSFFSKGCNRHFAEKNSKAAVGTLLEKTQRMQ